MQKAQVGDFFVDELGYYEVVDLWGEDGYCLVRSNPFEHYYFTDKDLIRIGCVHHIKCIQVTLPDTQSKLILRAEDISSFELDTYLPDFMFMEPGDTVKMEVILYPKDKFDALKEFEG